MQPSLAHPNPPPRPMVLIALAHMAGLALGLAWPPAAPVALAMAGLCLGWAGWRLWRSRRVHGPRAGTGGALLLALLALGWWQGGGLVEQDRAARQTSEPWTREELVCLEGTIAQEPQMTEKSARLVLERLKVTALRTGGGSVRLPVKAIVTVCGEALGPLRAQHRALPLPGQSVRAWGRLRSPLNQTTPSPFDAEAFWLSQEVTARLTVMKSADLELGARPPTLEAFAAQGLRMVRDKVAQVLARRLTPEQVPLARALLLGEAHLLSPEAREAYSSTGLAHLWAVSGLNTAFVLLLLLGLTRALGLTPRRGAVLGMAGLIAYAALTGFQPPVVRAMIMGLFILAGFCLERVTTTLASLATAAFVTLAVEPRNILRVDWQLSYACVLAVVVITPPLYELFAPKDKNTLAIGQREERTTWNWWRRIINEFLWLPLATVISVQLVLYPIQVATFRQYNILSPLYNIPGVALSLWAMAGIMATAVLGWIPGLGALIGLVARAGIWLLSWFVEWAASIPHMSVVPRPLPLAVVGIYYAVLFCGSWLRTGTSKNMHLGRSQLVSLCLHVPALLAILAWWPIVFPAKPPLGEPDGRGLDFYMLDVGQGDGLVARFPNGRVLVLDGGPAGTSDQGRLTVGPFLHTLGVDTIDCLVASHADADHIGGLPYLLDHFKVRLMLEGSDTATSELYRLMREHERRLKIDQHQARPGEQLAGFEPAEIRLLGPLPGQQDNNASLVLLIRYGDFKLLLTGDLEAAGERQLLGAGLGADIDILKLGHHGSRSSSSEEFFAALRPEAALISAGRHNRYGHPAPDVLRRLEARRIQPYRTDQFGTVWVHSDGRRIQIFRYLGP